MNCMQSRCVIKTTSNVLIRLSNKWKWTLVRWWKKEKKKNLLILSAINKNNPCPWQRWLYPTSEISGEDFLDAWKEQLLQQRDKNYKCVSEPLEVRKTKIWQWRQYCDETCAQNLNNTKNDLLAKRDVFRRNRFIIYLKIITRYSFYFIY